MSRISQIFLDATLNIYVSPNIILNFTEDEIKRYDYVLARRYMERMTLDYSEILQF